MTRYPDSRIAAEQSRLPMPHDDTVARFSGVNSPRDRSLPAYSGGTVWVFHPLRMVPGERLL